MRFRLRLLSQNNKVEIPINYQYPISAAIYKILNQANTEYASFLHETGYGKGFKFFSFSQLNAPFKIEKDRMIIPGKEVSFDIAFQLPDAAENFIKGLFQTQKIDIADKFSKSSFNVTSVESLKNRLNNYPENEIIALELKPLSPVVCGWPTENGNYEFLSPDDKRFEEVLVHNWREKIKACFGESNAKNALLILGIHQLNTPPKSRLITIKADTKEQTKIRGWMNFRIKVTAEKRLIELLLNTGAGVYNAMGCGMVEG